jgi:hypothetical protein
MMFNKGVNYEVYVGCRQQVSRTADCLQAGGKQPADRLCRVTL